ncbi:uncharacterized protein SCHCODRAFT_02636602 [Schizophyllum commune H4-8]|uniref:Carbohydrate esterase family 16 protein n=1 Tax=Schizophyllum commune (strain H4-8 / FGSC 9210) TaxID=578458 RepID=D8QEA0_SCHCM|nr:uncharacterized protein SCHCODRAFT_02636602 [Schizophyllum commune H4-8]KAI5888385.1 hypothetical protein SCHCODRAFT_02636602 [Schizophyllum commune H4-8]
MAESNEIVQATSSWPGLDNIKRLVVFGASYCAIGNPPSGSPRSAILPLGVPFPGWGCYTDRDTDTSNPRPNWVGHLISRYWPEPRYRPPLGAASDGAGDDGVVGGSPSAGEASIRQPAPPPHSLRSFVRGLRPVQIIQSADPAHPPPPEPPMQDHAYARDPLLVFDYAVGGHRVPDALHQIRQAFLPELAEWHRDAAPASIDDDPDAWRMWTSRNSLFITWIGINDSAFIHEPKLCKEPVDKLFAGQHDLYAAGARNFMLVDVPHIDRTPGAKNRPTPSPIFPAWNRALLARAKTFAQEHPGATVLVFSSARAIDNILDDPDIYGFPASDVRKANGAIWMDRLHPTSAVHDVLAREMAEFLGGVPSV